MILPRKRPGKGGAPISGWTRTYGNPSRLPVSLRTGYSEPLFGIDNGAGLPDMFYTNRRASMKLPDPRDVDWVHGTAIGIATSPDGVQWDYQGTAQFPKACTDVTLWAPDVQYVDGTYHMWLTIVPASSTAGQAGAGTARPGSISSRATLPGTGVAFFATARSADENFVDTWKIIGYHC